MKLVIPVAPYVMRSRLAEAIRMLGIDGYTQTVTIDRDFVTAEVFAVDEHGDLAGPDGVRPPVVTVRIPVVDHEPGGGPPPPVGK